VILESKGDWRLIGLEENMIVVSMVIILWREVVVKIDWRWDEIELWGCGVAAETLFCLGEHLPGRVSGIDKAENAA